MPRAARQLLLERASWGGDLEGDRERRVERGGFRAGFSKLCKSLCASVPLGEDGRRCSTPVGDSTRAACRRGQLWVESASIMGSEHFASDFTAYHS